MFEVHVEMERNKMYLRKGPKCPNSTNTVLEEKSHLSFLPSLRSFSTMAPKDRHSTTMVQSSITSFFSKSSTSSPRTITSSLPSSSFSPLPPLTSNANSKANRTPTTPSPSITQDSLCTPSSPFPFLSFQNKGSSQILPNSSPLSKPPPLTRKDLNLLVSSSFESQSFDSTPTPFDSRLENGMKVEGKEQEDEEEEDIVPSCHHRKVTFLSTSTSAAFRLISFRLVLTSFLSYPLVLSLFLTHSSDLQVRSKETCS